MASASDEASHSSRSRLARVARWGGGILGGLLVLVIVAALLIPQFFTSEELKGYVIPPLEEATGRQVEIDEIELRVLWTPAVSLQGFRLANREGYGPEPAVEAEALNVEIALWPLLTGTVEPTAVVLVDPVVRYVVAEDGTTNFEDLMAADTTQAEEEAGFTVPVSDFRTTGAEVLYEDRQAGQTVLLNFSAQLNLLPEGEALTSEGTVDVQSLRAVSSGEQADTTVVTDAQIEYDVRADLSAGRVELSPLLVETAPMTLRTTGTITQLKTRPTLDLAIEAEEGDIGQIAALMPAAAVEGLNPSGSFQFSATIQGPLPDSTGAMDSLSVDGTGQLSSVGVDYGGAALLRDLSAELAVSRQSASVRSIEGRLLGRPLEGEVTIRDPLESPTVEGQLAGAANVAELAALASEEPVPEAVEGTAEYDVRFSGSLDDPGTIHPEGRVHLTDVQYPYETFRHPIQVSEATVQLTGPGLSMDRFPIRIGEQEMHLAATVRNLFPLSKGLAETDPAMAVDFTFTSDRLNLVKLYPEEDTSEVGYSELFAASLSGTAVNGAKPEALAEEIYGDTELPPYAVDGQVKIATFLNDPQEINDLTFDVWMRNRRLELRNLTGKTYGGQFAGTLTFDQSGSVTSARMPESGSVLMAARGNGAAPVSPRHSSDGRLPPSDLSYDFELTDAEASAFLEEWTTLGDVVNGTLDLTIDGNTPLTEGLLPVADALTAEGTSIVADGGLSLDLGVVKQLAAVLGLEKSLLTEFQRFGGPFTIQDGTMDLGTWTLGGEPTDAELTGALGLGGSVDATMRMELPLSVLQNSKIPGLVGGGDGAIAGLVEKLAGNGAGNTTIPIEISIEGTMRNPTIEVVDKEAVRSAIRKLVKQEGLDRVRNLFDGG